MSSLFRTQNVCVLAFSLLFVRMIAADASLAHVLPYVYNGTSKHWFKYAKELIFLSLVNNSEELVPVGVVQNLLLVQFAKFQQLQTFSKRLLTRDTMTLQDTQPCSYDFEKYQEYGKISFLAIVQEGKMIRRATGQFTLGPNNHLYCDEAVAHAVEIKAKYKWYFRLNKVLSLNLTVLSIVFHGTIDCDHGHFRIQDELLESDLLQYCGQQAAFSAYLLSSDLTVAVEMLTFIQLEFIALFAVTDNGILVSYPEENSGEIKLNSVLLPTENHTLFSYTIEVKKIEHITLLFRELAMLLAVHDGPGFLSDTITLSKRVELSSFQCVFQVFLLSDQDNFSVEYMSTPKKYDEKLTVNQSTSMHLHITSQAHILPRLINVQSEDDLHVNVSITGQIYEGENSVSCKYGGIAFAENILGNYSERSFCDFEDNTSEVSHSIYSEEPSMTIIVYSFKHYSNISVTAKISQTKCSPVQIKSWYWHCSFIKRGEKCDTELQSLMTLTNASFYREAQYLIFSLPFNKCVVMQIFKLFAYPLIKHLLWLGFSLTHPADYETGGEIMYLVKGSIKPGIHTNDSGENFHAVGSVHDSRISSSVQEQYTIKKGKVKFGLKQDRKNKNDFVLLAKVRSPYSQATFSVSTILYEQTNSWIEITVWKHNTPEEANKDGRYSSKTVPLSKKYSLGDGLDAGGQLILLQVTAGIKRNFVARIGIETERPRQPNRITSEQLNWMTTHTFKNHLLFKCISLPGRISKFHVELDSFIDLDFMNDKLLRITWINDNYQAYSHLIEIEGVKCPFPENHANSPVCQKFANNFKSSRASYVFLLQRPYLLAEVSIDLYLAVRPALLQFLRTGNPWSLLQLMNTPLPDTEVFQGLNLLDVFAVIVSSIKMGYKQKASGGKHLVPKSWEEAAALCNMTGGHPPYFTSKEEVDELIAFLKLNPNIPLIPALFIALKKFRKEKVSEHG